MKYLMMLVTALAILGLTGSGSADVLAPNANNLVGYGGKANNGIVGTISAVAGSKFQMTSDTGNKTYVVTCTSNTNFMSGKEKADPTIVKVGAHVGVQGGQNNGEIFAQTVTLMAGKR